MPRYRSTAAVIAAAVGLTAPLYALNPVNDGPYVGEQIEDKSPGVLMSLSDRILRAEAVAVGPEFSHRWRNNEPGVWAVPKSRQIEKSGGDRYLINTWGDTRIGFSFDQPLDVLGFNVIAHGDTAKGLIVVGYRDNIEVARSARVTHINDEKQWVALGFTGVDRIEFESEAVRRGSGFFGLDDLTLIDGVDRRVLDFEDLDPGQKLSGSKYAGISWERGTGPIDPAFDLGRDFNIMPGPISSPFDEEEVAQEEDDRPNVGRGGLGTSPTLISEFNAGQFGQSNSGFIPPDTHGAIGPTHYVCVINAAFQIYNRSTGVRVGGSPSLGTIMPGTSGDPRIKYDQYADRFVAVSTNFNNRIYMAVSETNDPTGAWFSFNWVASTGTDSGCFPDYPTLGLDANGYYVGAFMVGCGFTLFTIEKDPLIAPVPSVGTITAFRSVGTSTMQPAHHYGTTPGAYVVSRLSASNARVWTVTGPLTSPTLSSASNIGVPFAGPPPDADASGSTTDLDTLDARYMNAVHRDGVTYFCNTINASNRSAVRWYMVDIPNLTYLGGGLIDDAVLFYNMPSINVNGRGSIVVGMSGSYSGQFVGAYFCGRIPSDPAGEMSVPVQYRTGLGAYNILDSFGRNRWGDYSHTSVDPLDDNRFWTNQEYATTGNRWATRVAQVELIALPDSFSLLTPADGTTDVDADAIISLDWEDALDADDYTVEVFTDPGLTSPAIPSFVVGSSNADLSGGTLADNTTYYWTATASNTTGTTIPAPDQAFEFTTAFVPPPCPCVGDLDGDCDTDVFDFNIFAPAFGSTGLPPFTGGDLDGDGDVDVFDFNLFAPDFGCTFP